ncbi:hypothetical protein GTP23_00465 [Pseudoduganella sp. FT93W]|uniref:YcxB-like C-terminal domain-containing protein n=1 Tax=Duganella fentianensis TaxID=2692177 RepID=A0A845HV53_9BURK|nr:YcxB family protein [Duganella fentianensis]MYN43537.1 hypothetical protein [Duganella fentianensis]
MQVAEPSRAALRLHVRYRLGEYLGIVTSHVIAELTRRKLEQGKKISLLDIIVLRSCLLLFVPPIFIFKVLKVGACDFYFDDTGITRHSKGGELVVPWDEVVAIHTYPAGYLFAQSDGAMPVPFRVLADEQHALLKSYIIRHQPSVC